MSPLAVGTARASCRPAPPSVSNPPGFPVSVLAERTGVPVPTIHHYRRLGLLPPETAVASNRFLYDERHVAALTIIRVLRERRQLPLETVRLVLPELLAGGLEDRPAEEWDEIVAAHLDEESAMSPSRLLAIAREEFARRGYAGVCVGDLCEAAGIAKGSFYRYFESKDEIFVAAARSTVDAVGEALERLPGTLDEEEATEELRFLLEPLAPLLLEAATRELRREPEVTGLVAGVAQGLATRLLPRLRGRGAVAIPAARRVVDAALLRLLRPALGLGSPV